MYATFHQNNRNLRAAENYIGAADDGYEECPNDCGEDECNCVEARAEAQAEAQLD